MYVEYIYQQIRNHVLANYMQMLYVVCQFCMTILLSHLCTVSEGCIEDALKLCYSVL